MTKDEPFLSQKRAATMFETKFKATGAFIVLGLLLMVLLPVSCRGDGKPAHPNISVAVINEKGDAVFQAEIAVADIKDFKDIETITLASDSPRDGAPDARVALEPVSDDTSAPDATVTLAVHGPGLGDDGWSARIAWPPKSSLFLVLNKKHVVALDLNPEPDSKSGNDDGPAASAGDIEVFVEMESGGRVPGAEVRLSLPGPDGSMEKMPNSLFAVKDGGPDDADGLRNGRVLLPAKYARGSIASGQNFAVDTDVRNFVLPEEQVDTYSDSGANSVTLTLIRINKKP